MSALIDTLTTAPAGSRELDARVGEALGWKEHQPGHCASWCEQHQEMGVSEADYFSAWCPEYTTSLDATFAEAQRRGLRLVVDTDKAPNKPQAAIWDNRAKGWKTAVRAATPALAACAALIAAVEAG